MSHAPFVRLRTAPIVRAVVASAALALVGVAAGCKPALIPGASVEDSAENRKVLTFLTRYQAAMQERSVDKLAALCAADYFEDNGNDDPKDDYNLDGLKARLTEHFARTKELVLEVYVQQVERVDDGHVGVAYRYNTRALVGFPSGDKWLTATEVNKIILRPVEKDEAGYRILSGL
ncbi:MAG: hypothetical protein FJ137_09065 [Deltaproteobacteria bacterium]|nr:hypothetical protein [Deltaproteobacteria bacterium]